MIGGVGAGRAGARFVAEAALGGLGAGRAGTILDIEPGAFGESGLVGAR